MNVTTKTPLERQRLKLRQRCAELKGLADIAWEQHRQALLHIGTCVGIVTTSAYDRPAESILLAATVAANRAAEAFETAMRAQLAMQAALDDYDE